MSSSPLLYQFEVLVLFIGHDVNVLAEYVLGLKYENILTPLGRQMLSVAPTRNLSAGKLKSRRASPPRRRGGDSVESKSMSALSVVIITLPGCSAMMSLP